MSSPAIDHAEPAAIRRTGADAWALSGSWTAQGLGVLPDTLTTEREGGGAVAIDGARLTALDTAGAWVLQNWLRRQGAEASLSQWPERMRQLMTLIGEQSVVTPPAPLKPSALTRIGRGAWAEMQEGLGLLQFTGEVAITALRVLAHPRRLRLRAVLHNIQVDGFNALPIIGLTAFLLGVVVAYQGADQLRHYGANVFVVELVGYAMLREFAPLISAMMIAGRSGSAYSAQIGTMVVTEEVDAMRTLAIDPIELLVLPKILGLAVALPLLTMFADLTGVFGGMVMARSQLDIGFPQFIDRFGREIEGATLLIGIGKSLVFAVVIAVIGCFQGFRARGSAESVGRQTTRSVVQAIFIVIVADALFSIVFSLLDL